MRHDPQRFMGKTVTVPHFSRDTILGDKGAVSRVDKMFVVKVFCKIDLTENFHHEHFIGPTNCPWVSEKCRGTVEVASRKRDESNQGIKTLLPFLKNITEESDLENFQDLIVALDACYWLHKTISRSLSRFGDDRAI